MPDLTEEQKTALKQKEEEEKKKEDPFADIFKKLDTAQHKSPPPPEIKPEDKKVDKPLDVEEYKPDLSAVDQRVSAAITQIDRRSNVNDFLQGDKGKIFSKFASQIRQAASMPEFASIPVAQLPQVILTPEAYSKVLTEAREEADRDAADSVIGGSSSQTLVPEELRTIDPLSMSQEEFRTLKDRAKHGDFKIKRK